MERAWRQHRGLGRHLRGSYENPWTDSQPLCLTEVQRRAQRTPEHASWPVVNSWVSNVSRSLFFFFFLWFHKFVFLLSKLIGKLGRKKIIKMKKHLMDQSLLQSRFTTNPNKNKIPADAVSDMLAQVWWWWLWYFSQFGIIKLCKIRMYCCFDYCWNNLTSWQWVDEGKAAFVVVCCSRRGCALALVCAVYEQKYVVYRLFSISLMYTQSPPQMFVRLYMLIVLKWWKNLLIF